MKKYLLYLLSFCAGLMVCAPAMAQNIRYRGNIKGGFTLTGNSFRHNTIFDDFLNTDSTHGVTRSSAADLILPSGSKIIKAILYVEGLTATPITSVKFKVPGGSYMPYNTSSAGFIANPNSMATYQQFIVDVTDVMPANGYVTTAVPGGTTSGAGRYSVADFSPMQATNFGYGWSLFVVYTNPDSKYRCVTLADYCTYLSPPFLFSMTVNDIVVPAFGPVSAVVGVTGSYGDYGADWGDNITLGVAGGNARKLADPFTGDTTDVLNSSIAFTALNNVSTDGGPAISGNFTARKPYLFSCPNVPAIPNWSSYFFDADILDASGILPNSTVPIDVTLTQNITSADALGSGAYALSIDMAGAVLTKSIAPAIILPGASATCTFTIDNNQPGAINLSDIEFTDSLPDGLRIANPASVVINGTAAVVIAPPGGNAVTVAGVSLAAGQTATVAVAVTNVPGQINPDCAATPPAFTNGFKNIFKLSSNLVNNVDDQCLVITPSLPPATLPLTYCQFDVAVPLTATGINLRWYTLPAGGTGTSIAPTPATALPGVYTWYVSQTVDGIESPRSALAVTVTPPMKPLFDTMVVCLGAKTPPFPPASLNGITGTWYPGAISTAATATYLFTPHAGQCALPATMTVVVKPGSEMPEILEAGFMLSRDTICQYDTISFSNTSRVHYQPGSCIWYLGDGASNPNNDVRHSYGRPGTYLVTFVLSDSLSCRDTAYRIVTVDSIPSLELLVDRNTLCTGESVELISVNSRQGLRSLTWSFGDNDYAYNQSPVKHAYDDAGRYGLSITARYRACKDIQRMDTVTVFPFPNVYIGPDTSICPESAPLLLSNQTEHLPGDHYHWSTGDTTASIIVKQAGSYSLRVVGNQGCETKDETIVRKDCYLDIPNSFTPNGDGINDYFFPKQLASLGVQSFSMTVLNRWGQVIFTTQSANGRGWDGRFNGMEQPVGVYIFKLDVGFKNGKKENYTDNVTLLR